MNGWGAGKERGKKFKKQNTIYEAAYGHNGRQHNLQM